MKKQYKKVVEYDGVALAIAVVMTAGIIVVLAIAGAMQLAEVDLHALFILTALVVAPWLIARLTAEVTYEEK